jgi:ABC-2 type transport system ATP-binding protein
LSYGQKKKVLLSFGLATNCRLLILDEPTNGLDIPSKSQFRSLLARNTRDDQIVIISTHQVRDMANLIDPIVILENGEIIFQQALEEITRQLHFELVSGMNEPEDVLYAERVPGGWLTVSKNETGQESEMDVEVLFNAVVTKRHLINELF